MILSWLLTDTITIFKQTKVVAGNGVSVGYRHDQVATGVPTRFNPEGADIQPFVVGRAPKRRCKIFVNLPLPVGASLQENYEVVRASDSKRFCVKEAKDFFGHHIEASLEEMA